jgi:hypothetical protein
MATTTNYGWTTPDDTALVKDGAAAIRTLGSSVDTTTKALNPETTLGDLAYRSSTANVKTRLGLGTAGQVLTVNSGATAPEWANAAGGAVPLLTLEESSRYITTTNTTLSELVATEDTTYYVPIFLPTVSIDRIAVTSGQSFTSAGNTRLGLYNASSTTGKPTTLVFDAGTVNVTENGTDFAITISQNITANWYYLAVNRQGGTYDIKGTVAITGLNTVASTLTGASMKGYSEASIPGALPATVGTLTVNTTRNPIAGVRIV